jgi:drug/metabolite transporter (DMT)-like permease
MGLFGSGLAPLCHFTVLKRGGPVNAMLASIVVPITPIVLGVAFLGEHIGPRELLGGGIIAIALIIIDGRVFGALRRRFMPKDIAS